MRRIFYACVLVWLSLLCSVGRAAHVYFNLQNFTTQNVSNKTFKIVPLSMPSSSGGAIILREPQTLTTSNGTFYVSNMVAGSYSCTVGTPITPTTFTLPVPDTNGVVNAYQLVTNGLSITLLTNLYTGNILWVDRANGNDFSAARNDLVHRFQSIGAAKTNAQSGDTVVIFPGLYNERNLMKAGLTVYAMPGCMISNTIPTNTDSGYGLFDDRVAGAAGKFTLDGFGEYIFRNSNPSCPYAFGGIFISNANSEVSFRGKSIKASARNELSFTSAITTLNNSNVAYYTFDEIADTGDLWSDLDPDEPSLAASHAEGIYWELGNVIADVKRIAVQGGNAFYGNDTVLGTGSTNSFYLTSEVITNRAGQSAIYVKSDGLNYRTWILAKEVGNGTGSPAAYFGGRNYLDAQKLRAVASGAGSGLIFSGAEFWGRIEKVEADRNWVIVSGGTNTIDLTVQEFADVNKSGSSQISGGIDFGTGAYGSVFIHGGRMSAGTNAQNLVLHRGNGKLSLENLLIDASNNTHTNGFGLNVVSNGVVLRNVQILAGTGTNLSVQATNSLTLEIQGNAYFSKGMSASLTQSNGWLQAGSKLIANNPVEFRGSTNVLVHTNASAGSYLTTDGSNAFWATVSSSSGNGWPGVYRIFTQTSDSQNTNATVTTNSFFGSGVGSLTLSNGFWQVGRSVRMEGKGRIWTPGATAPTLLMLNAYVGTTPNTIATNFYTFGTSISGDMFNWDFLITCRTNSSIGFLAVQGDIHQTTSGSDTYRFKTLFQTGLIFDVTQGMTLDFASTNGAATMGFVTREANALLIQ